jgi:hypothetical protein
MLDFSFPLQVKLPLVFSWPVCRNLLENNCHKTRITTVIQNAEIAKCCLFRFKYLLHILYRCYVSTNFCIFYNPDTLKMLFLGKGEDWEQTLVVSLKSDRSASCSARTNFDGRRSRFMSQGEIRLCPSLCKR